MQFQYKIVPKAVFLENRTETSLIKKISMKEVQLK